MRFFSFSPLRSPAGDSDGSGPIPTIDPGVPFEHGDEPSPKAAPKAEKSDVERRLEALEADLTSAKRERDEARESERYWANRARSGGDRNEAAEEEFDPDPEIPSRPARRAPAVDDKPERLLDDMSAEGLEALRKRGIITQEQLDEAIEQAEQRANERAERRIQAAESNAEWASKFAQEFPEIAADNARVERGEKPQSDLFRRTAEIFKQMVTDDPKLKNSQGTVSAAARAAKRELAAEAKAVENDRRVSSEDRRERIDRQRGERDRGGMDEPGEAPISKLGSQVIGHLARWMDPQGRGDVNRATDAYRDNQGRENSNGMTHVGGKRR